MRVYVNDQPVDLLRGMTVRHALLQAEHLRELKTPKKVYDQWGNEVGLDGALSEELKLYVK
jgi:hypothetical protein